MVQDVVYNAVCDPISSLAIDTIKGEYSICLFHALHSEAKTIKSLKLTLEVRRKKLLLYKVIYKYSLQIGPRAISV